MAHQGKAFEYLILRSPYSKREIAKKIQRTDRTLYYWLNKETLLKNEIDELSTALNIDVYKTMPEIFGHGVVNKLTSKVQAVTTESTEFWKNKCIEKMEELNAANQTIIILQNELSLYKNKQ